MPASAYQSMHDEGTAREQPWDNCTLCHGADLKGDLGPACTTCHDDFTEPDLPPRGHHVGGVEEREDPQTNCALCHGGDLKGDIGPSCFSCHDQLWEGGGGGGNSPPNVVPGGPYAGTVGVPVQFDASGTTDPDGDTLTYIWDFGDNSFPSGGGSPVVTHVYQAPGTYTATLAVADGVGLPVSAQVEVTITETNAPPTASAGGPYSGTANQAITFDASASTDPDGDTLTYTWDFGDGSPVAGPSASATATHTYQTPGSYVATVTVADGVNDPATDTADVNVAPDDGGGGGGGGGGGTLPPGGNGWDVQFPWVGMEGTVQFRDFGTWLLVDETIDNGPALFGIGFRVEDTIVWLDSTGSLFIGSQSPGAESMLGIVFNLPGGANTVWFARPQAPPAAPDLGALGDLLGSGLPDVGSLFGSGDTGTDTGDTGRGTGGGDLPPIPGVGDGGSSATSGGTGSAGGGESTGGGVAPAARPATRPRAYDVYQEHGARESPGYAPIHVR